MYAISQVVASNTEMEGAFQCVVGRYMANRSALLQNIATIIQDYRAGEIATPDEAHVEQWVRQFPADVQDPILDQLAHVLGKAYFNRKAVESFVATVVSAKKLTGDDPCAYWKGVKFLALQTAGNSQRDMLQLFDAELRKQCGLSIPQCGEAPHSYVDLDDALYSGGRIKHDLERWIAESAPVAAKVEIITIGLHTLGEFFATKDIKVAATKTGKKIETRFWRLMPLEDRKAYMANSDVLRPTAIPNDPATQAYVATLGAEPILRTGGNVGGQAIFSSDVGRRLLEEEFLKAGVRVKNMCPHLNDYMRPLGCSLMKTLGFGSTIVTYRNCANNTPLVLWAGNPWYPLFPRKIN